MAKIIDFQSNKKEISRYTILVGYNASGELPRGKAYYRYADGTGDIEASIYVNSLDEIPAFVKIAQEQAQRL